MTIANQFAPVWNASGVNFSAIRANVTDIASSGGSTLLDLRVNDSGVMALNKSGLLSFGGTTSSFPAFKRSGTAINFRLADDSADAPITAAAGTFTGAVRIPTNDTGIYFSATGNSVARVSTFSSDLYIDSTAGWVRIRTNASATQNCIFYGGHNPVSAEFGSSISIGSNTILITDGSDTLAQRRSTNAQRFNLYGTYTDASNYRRLYVSSTTAGAFTLGVEGAGTGASGNTLNIGPGITIDRGGFVISVESSLILATTVLQLNSDTGQLRGRNGRIILSDNATGSTFDLLRFGGITNSFPAIKRNGTALNFRLADDSADAPITASNGTFSGHLSATTKSFLIDHPTKPGRKLQYGSLESPYHGIRLTGRSFVEGGIGVIELPDYVRAFVSDDVNIQLTPVGRNILWVDCIDLNNNQVIVGADSDGDFYWSFTGIRTDVELEVEPWA